MKSGRDAETKRFLDQSWLQRPQTIRQFLEQKPKFEQLCKEIAYIVERRLNAALVDISTVSWRAKTLDSFLEKIRRKNYAQPFEEITDFAGVRIVCLYLGDVPSIEKMIRDEFEVLEKVDKLHDKGTDRFGYGATHFIVRLSPKSQGARYDDLRPLACEIQVRSVLQDAWAIIDHHLVYKTESDIPKPLQRKMNSLAGLFETADDQFDRVRIEREAYLEQIRQSQSDPQVFLATEVNNDSLYEYLEWKYPHLPVEQFRGEITMVREIVSRSNYSTLADIDNALRKADLAVGNILRDISDPHHDWVNHGATIMLTSLAVTDELLRRCLMFPDSIRELVQKNKID